MTEAPQKRRGRPPGVKKDAPATATHSTAPDIPVQLETADAPPVEASALIVEYRSEIPKELRSTGVVKALDDAGYLEAAKLIGDAILDPDQQFRNEVRTLCVNMPVIFHFSSLEEATAKAVVVKAMEGPPGRRYATAVRGADLDVSLRPA
jgi:hypothetical protein